MRTVSIPGEEDDMMDPHEAAFERVLAELRDEAGIPPRLMPDGARFTDAECIAAYDRDTPNGATISRPNKIRVGRTFALREAAEASESGGDARP